jgi:hypothetical protein
MGYIFFPYLFLAASTLSSILRPVSGIEDIVHHTINPILDS